MATMITDECINCGACEPECPNTAIYQGGVEWEALDSSKRPAISGEIFYIVPEKCTECVGFYDHEACAAVCPVDCCVPNPDIPESEDVLIARARQIHPSQDFASEFPSRFRAGGTESPAASATAPPDAPPASPTGAAAPSPAVAPGAASASATLVASPEDALAAEVPPIEEYPVPLVCFRCTGGFEVEFQYLRPGTVLHCPHCLGSYVPNTAMYQAIGRRLRRFYDSWVQSLEELRTRRARELERFEASQRSALEILRGDVQAIGNKAELAGAPQRNRGFFG
jgi:ferredoxin